ncbi:hypothetical protein QR680_002768 [Steinernema hermaphroditum]|uniref:Uncharacterized protein n=1 Tax=Steinernema hermaphroditum TaxID=289476 RepID=A0AA39LIC6_9BILA|nr:hypothetical protein QR680_002768 [Steinernema hermaphroditum]
MGKPFSDCIKHICGVVVNVRKNTEKVAECSTSLMLIMSVYVTVWARDADNKEISMYIAGIIKKALDILIHKTLFYVTHTFQGPTSRPELMYTV